MTATTTAGRRPVARQVVLTLGYVACVLGSMVGVGVFGGTPIAEAAGGALAGQATHLAPEPGARGGAGAASGPPVRGGRGVWSVHCLRVAPDRLSSRRGRGRAGGGAR